MRLAAFVYQQQPQVGLVSDDLQSVTLLDLPVAERVLGALPIVERLCGGAGLPSLLQTVPLKDVRLTAPLPRPRIPLRAKRARPKSRRPRESISSPRCASWSGDSRWAGADDDGVSKHGLGAR